MFSIEEFYTECGFLFENTVKLSIAKAWKEKRPSNFDLFIGSPVFSAILEVEQVTGFDELWEKVKRYAKTHPAFEEIWRYAKARGALLFGDNSLTLEYAQYGWDWVELPEEDRQKIKEAQARGWEAYFSPLGFATPPFGELEKTRGKFINADFIFISKKGDNRYIHILDTSHRSYHDIDKVESVSAAVRRRLEQETSLYLSSAYSTGIASLVEKKNSYVTTGNKELTISLANRLLKRDRDVSKLIQATSYGHTLLAFLQKNRTPPAEAFMGSLTEMFCSGVSGIPLTQSFPLKDIEKTIKETASFYEVYRRSKGDIVVEDERFDKMVDYLRNPQELEIFHHFSLEAGRDFAQLNMDVRREHTRQVVERLQGNELTTTLLACPGIGKTYSVIATAIKNEKPTFIFYLSPRKAILEHFREELFSVLKDMSSNKRAIVFNTNSLALKGEGVDRSIFFAFSGFSAEEQRVLNEVVKEMATGRDPINFREANSGEARVIKDIEEDTASIDSHIDKNGVRHITKTVSHHKVSGVISTLMEKSKAFITKLSDRGISPEIVATTATLQAFEHATHRGVKPVCENMFSIRERHLFLENAIFMFDEITGSESSMGKLWEFQELLTSKGDPRIKFVPCDASILGYETYKGLVSAAAANSLRQSFVFEDVGNHEGVFSSENSINFFGYPAQKLDIYFGLAYNKYEASKELVEKVLYSCEQGRFPLVYIQDKELGEDLRERLGKEGIRSITVNSESEYDKEKFDKAEAYIVTSSASRGISFPRTLDIFALFPSFSPAQNAMELNQLIYRMRGSFENEYGARTNYDNKDKNVYLFFQRPSYGKAEGSKKWVETPELLEQHSEAILRVSSMVEHSIRSRVCSRVEMGGVIPGVSSTPLQRVQAFQDFTLGRKRSAKLRGIHQSFEALDKELSNKKNRGINTYERDTLAKLCEVYFSQMRKGQEQKLTEAGINIQNLERAIREGRVEEDIQKIINKKRGWKLLPHFLMVESVPLVSFSFDVPQAFMPLFESSLDILASLKERVHVYSLEKASRDVLSYLKTIMGKGQDRDVRYRVEDNEQGSETLFIYLNPYYPEEEEVEENTELDKVVVAYIASKYRPLGVSLKAIHAGEKRHSHNGEHGLLVLATDPLDAEEIVNQESITGALAAIPPGFSKRTIDFVSLEAAQKFI